MNSSVYCGGISVYRVTMPKTIKQQGTVQSFNVSPKGNYEGFLLQTENGLIQVNCRDEFEGNIAEAAPEGSEIELELEPERERGEPAHPVYRLMELNGGDGAFAGKVKRLNYALHGEVNGAVLDSGDFLHLKPEGASALGMKVGMKVKGTGKRKPMVGGFHVIEAEEVNGIPIENKPKPKKKAH